MKEELEVKNHECPIIRTCIRVENGISLTDVWKNGKIIKTHKTELSQVRPDRKSCLWNAAESKMKDRDIDEVEEETNRRNAYIIALNQKGKKGLHNRNAFI